MSIVFITFIFGTAVLLSWPLGRVMTWAMNPGDKVGGFRGGAERLFEKATGKVIAREQTWKEYVLSMLLFNGFQFLVVFVILAMQQVLPLNPDGKGALSFRAFCGGDPLPRELGVIVLVYGKDGNRLFVVPPKDGGLIVRAVDPKWDVPVDFQFGFDPRHFAHAHSAKIFLLAKGEVVSD